MSNWDLNQTICHIHASNLFVSAPLKKFKAVGAVSSNAQSQARWEKYYNCWSLRSYFSSQKDKLLVSSARREKKSDWKDLIGHTVRDEKVDARDLLLIHQIGPPKIGKIKQGKLKEKWVKKVVCAYVHAYVHACMTATSKRLVSFCG